MTRAISLTRGFVTIVDDADYEWLSQWKWGAEVKGDDAYAFRNTRLSEYDGRRRLYMHRELLGISDAGRGVIGDHIDGDTLNNRRSNLRGVTSSQSCMNRGKPSNNTSGVVGVYFNKKRGQWFAKIKVEGREICLGHVSTLKEAARLRREGERKYFGVYAREATG